MNWCHFQNKQLTFFKYPLPNKTFILFVWSLFKNNLKLLWKFCVGQNLRKFSFVQNCYGPKLDKMPSFKIGKFLKKIKLNCPLRGFSSSYFRSFLKLQVIFGPFQKVPFFNMHLRKDDFLISMYKIHWLVWKWTIFIHFMARDGVQMQFHAYITFTPQGHGAEFVTAIAGNQGGREV